MTKTGHVFTPDTATEWKNAISTAVMQIKKEIISTQVRLTVTFFMPIPKSKLKKIPDECTPHSIKPDTDNLLKAVMDSLSAQVRGKTTAASVWTDDSLVFYSVASKWYTPGLPGAKIKVEVLA